MAFLTDVTKLKDDLILFRRSDVQHRKWYCRMKVPGVDRYKTVALKIESLREAQDKAFEHYADLRFRLKHNVPIFGKTFEEVALKYSDELKTGIELGRITAAYWKVVDAYIRNHLIEYCGKIQIAQMGEEKWKEYPLWRKRTGKGARGEPVQDGTIRHELITFRAILRYAADKHLLPHSSVPKGKVLHSRARREAFNPQEYRHLHTYARKWVNHAQNEEKKWYRTIIYNFILVMANTGMRTIEARNLRWRDVDARIDKQGRQFCCLNVRGKNKYRELVAPQSVATYFERIKEISKATGPDDPVFSTLEGKSSSTLFSKRIRDILTGSKLLYGSSKIPRSSYCLRHTYATFRLMEGVDVYFLAKQMGTSVRMIEDHYGHITPSKNADLILQGIPGWEPAKQASAAGSEVSVNADSGGIPSTKSRSPKR
jgi:integrase